ncbi:MAG: hypothetical protein ACM31L_19700, partial [Actinomycetota bacterium]
VAAVDDEGGAVVADLVVNGTVLDQYHQYPVVPAGARVLAGPSYTLLRPAFAATPWRRLAEPSVTIVVGSGDRARDWAFALTEVDRRGWGPVAMVVGNAFPDFDALHAACAHAGIRLLRGLDAASLAAELASARLALITGGMVVYEALAVGVPAVVFPQVPNLIPEALWFADKGCIRDLGFDGGLDRLHVARSVAGLIGDDDALLAMSGQARALVDGRGLERAARALDEMFGREPRR